MNRRIACGMVVYDEWTTLSQALDSLKNEFIHCSVEWIFVLNHPAIEIRQKISRLIQNQLKGWMVSIFENPQNNIAQSRQWILQKATSDWVYFSDPDIKLQSGSLLKLLTKTNPEKENYFLGFGGILEHTSNNFFIQATYDFIQKCNSFLARFGTHWSFQTQIATEDKIVDHLPTCHLLLHRKKALQLGGFNSYFDRVGEDAFLSFSAYQNQIFYKLVAGSSAVHQHDLTTFKWLKKIYKFGFAQIDILAFYRHQNPGQSLKWRWYRHLPIVLTLAFLCLAILLTNQALWILLAFTAAVMCGAFLTKGGLIGLALVTLVYSLGQVNALIGLFLLRQNVKKSLAIKARTL